MKFSIITPSFRCGKWLSLCIASVADQEIEHEHIVQDSCSDDGTLDWLSADARVTAIIEKDEGMYDAINRGLRRASGDILAYLNCDEQYLPGALSVVREYFLKHPDIQLLCTDAILVDDTGEYLAHRQVCRPKKYHSLVGKSLAILTCATFFRRAVIEQGLFFDPEFKNIGDAEWMVRVLDRGIRIGCEPIFTSVYTCTGANLSLSPDAERERRRLAALAPWWVKRSSYLFTMHHRLRRLLAGHYRRLPPFTYAIYTQDSPSARVLKRAVSPTFRWPDVVSYKVTTAAVWRP